MSRVHLRSPEGEPLCGRVPSACACMTSDIAETTCRWCLARGAPPRVKPSRPFHHRHAAKDILAALQGGGSERDRLAAGNDVFRAWSARLRNGKMSDPGYAEWCSLFANFNVSVDPFLRVCAADAPTILFEQDCDDGCAYVPLTVALAALIRDAEECAGLRPRKGKERWLTKVRRGVEALLRRCTTEELADMILRGLRNAEGDYAEEYRAMAKECYTAWKATREAT